MKVAVIGGGIFGCCTAIELSSAGYEVHLIEREDKLMHVASRVNHNRIHLGYHYLRSAATAEQSLEGLLSFMFNYGNAVVNQFPNYYAIAKEGSKTSPEEFLAFCENVGIGYDEAYPDNHLLNKEALQACFKVPEPVFDFIKLKSTVEDYLGKSGTNIRLRTDCSQATYANTQYSLTLNGKEETFDVLVNAGYGAFNVINDWLGVGGKNLLYEDVIIPVFKYPTPAFGLTVMDGPFCSVMPHGRKEREFLLYHVRYSVLSNKLQPLPTDFGNVPTDAEDTLYKNASLFMPFVATTERMGYNRVTRVVHKNSDDARLTELYTYPELPNYFALLSGKITTCSQVALEIKHILQGKYPSRRFRI